MKIFMKWRSIIIACVLIWLAFFASNAFIYYLVSHYGE